MPYYKREEVLMGTKCSNFDMISNYGRMIQEEVDKLPSNQVVSSPMEDLVNYFNEKYKLDVPVVDPDAVFVESQGEAKIDVSHRFDYGFRRGERAEVSGQQIIVAAPFTGDPDLFHVRASRFTMSPPRIMIGSDHIYLRFADVQLDGERIRAEINRRLSEVAEHLQWLRNDFANWNEQLPGLVRQKISARKDRLLAQANVVASIGIPMKRRPDEALTYAAPEVRRRMEVRPPPAPKASFKPEPALDANEFEHILSIIGKVAVVFERSPASFARMGEEALRDHILVHLNGHYDSATGETFNAAGKTDILIRSGERNVFIAECKFWHGQKGYDGTIDQLLSYLTWRDTKAAVIIFNRNRNFSGVLQSVQEQTGKHPNFKRKLAAASETSFRYVFRQNSDEAREMHLAVLVFDIPSPEA